MKPRTAKMKPQKGCKPLSFKARRKPVFVRSLVPRPFPLDLDPVVRASEFFAIQA